MNGLEDEIPKGYSLFKSSHWYIKVLIAVGVLYQ